MTAACAILGDVRQAIAVRSVADHGGLVRHVTDLFLVNAPALGEDEIALFDDVFNALVREIDTAARALLALRLASVQNAPTGLMRTLASDDEPDVACPVLRHSERLDDRALVSAAQRQSQEHLLAISQRRSLSEAVTDVLVHRGDGQVLLSVAANSGARLSEQGFAHLVRHAESDDALAERVGRRKDIPPQLFAVLIRAASEHVRANLQDELLHDAREIQRSVQSAATHVARKHEADARNLEAVRASVERLHREGQLDDEQIRAFAADGLLEEVKVALMLISDLPAPFIDQALKQENGEMLLVIARATGLSWSTVKNILQLPIWRRPAMASEIRHCLARYEKLGRATAADIMKFYKARL
jgi:uncharacterized protein (DUF2336 family)